VFPRRTVFFPIPRFNRAFPIIAFRNRPFAGIPAADRLCDTSYPCNTPCYPEINYPLIPVVLLRSRPDSVLRPRINYTHRSLRHDQRIYTWSQRYSVHTRTLVAIPRPIIHRVYFPPTYRFCRCTRYTHNVHCILLFRFFFFIVFFLFYV